MNVFSKAGDSGTKASVFTREEFRERLWLKSHGELVKSGLTPREAYVEANRLERSGQERVMIQGARALKQEQEWGM